MRLSQNSVRKELGRELQRLGTERGGEVVCLVVLLDDAFEFVYPSELTQLNIWHLEQAIAATLGGTERPHTRI